METSFHSLSWRSRDGVTLSGRACGEGPPVILLHGFAQTQHAWDRTLSVLAEGGYQAISYDARGHGNSAYAEPHAYRLDDFAADLRLIRDGLDQAPILVGASMGGLTAMLCCGEGPEIDVRGLVVVDVAPRWAPEGVGRIMSFLEAYPDGFDDLDQVRAALHQYLPHRRGSVSGGDGSGGNLRHNLRRGVDGRLHWHWDSAMLAHARDVSFHQHRLSLAARRIRQPTLLVTGEQSEVMEAQHIEEFLHLIPHAQHEDVSGARHMVAGDHNSAFTESILNWMTALDQRPLKTGEPV